MADQDNLNINQATSGLNLDNVITQIKPGQLTYALNAQVEGFDGNMVTYQNEQSNVSCITFPDGYRVVGDKNITQLSRVLFWLTNPTTGDSEIGYVDNDSCTYVTLISDVGNDCKFNFNIEYPIQKAVVKSTNCSTQVYWTDGYNPRRYIDFDALPWKEVRNPDNDFVPTLLVGQLDCNKLKVQPVFDVPKITDVAVSIGGQLQMGTYQFAVRYSNIFGEGYTSFYSVTNPLGIFDSRISTNFNDVTSKSIKIHIDNIDTSGIYDYIDVAVVKTINNNPSVELVGTFPIAAKTFDYNYTGESKSDVRLTIADIFEQFPYYDVADDVFEVDNVIGWSNLQANERLNYQDIWSNVKLYWESYKIPYNKFEAYNNGVNTANYKGYFRDEVYAFEGVFILKNGKRTDAFPIPGRIATVYDREIIENQDSLEILQNPCSIPAPKERWQVYNTGSVIAYSEEYVNSTTDPDCYVGPYQYGEFGYWESTDTYPNNPIIWGNLSGQRIRHHKFPDILISPIHSRSGGDPRSSQYFIYPIGAKIDPLIMYQAIQNSNLTQEQKDDIQGFEIVRGNRKTHEGIIAKGIVHNVGATAYYDKDGRNPEIFYYGNYPYNDLRPDPYYSSVFLQRDQITPPGFRPDLEIRGFETDDSKRRFVFHSPDTHFYQPSINNGGEYLKFESVEYGTSYGHFIKVKKNAEYKFLTRDTVYAAAGLGVASGLIIGAGTYGWPEFTMAPIAPTFNSAQELFEKLAPYTNFGYTHNSIGIYSDSYAIPNSGNKIRNIYFNKYIIDGKNSIEDGKLINNYRRESSVYVNTYNTFPFTHEYSSSIPTDTSRYNLASTPDPDKTPEKIRTNPISSFYASIKREVPDQWGKISSYETISTGYYQPLYDKDGRQIARFPTIFGGDIFINRFAYKSKQSIFTDTSVGEPNGTDIQYNETGNLNYPMFWLSTKPANFSIDITNEINALAGQLFNSNLLSIIGNIVTGAAIGSVIAMSLVRKLFSEIYDKVGIKNVNFDQASTVGITEQGLMYLFVYGIPYFFVESEVNVDYRQAQNDREGNFFPNVSEFIPDDWLQEINVPIIHDNTYFYNQTYSKQNKEVYFSHLRPDYDPDKRCLTFFPNRAIWSDKSSLEETKNNWVIYRPINFYDFPKSYGDLISIDKVIHNQMLVRFSNKAQVYNALTTVDVKNAPSAYVGKGNLFSSAPPIDISDTDIGYAGSQHKFFLRTEFGQVFIDSKRGQIILLNGDKPIDLTDKGVDKWCSENLPFNITRTIPNIDIDNNFNGIGLHGVYDQFYQRLIITKLDYLPLVSTIIYRNGRFYDTAITIEGGGKVDYKEIFLSDTDYFCNKSWTLSFCFKTNAWTSFHSYQPLYYIGYPNYFQSGVASGVWNHNKSFNSYCNFYGEQAPYVVEYPFVYKLQDEILQNIKEYVTVRKYSDFTTFYEPDETIFFNKSIIYNGQQCTGILNLVPKPKNNLSAYLTYPKYNTDSKDILVTKSDNFYNYNTFWDILKDKSVPTFTTTCAMNQEDKKLNDSNMDYSKRDYRKAQIRAKDCKVRHILDNRSDVRMINKFILSPTVNSYK